MEPILTTKDVNRVFPSGSGTVHALKDINVAIAPGTLTILRGRSGSGKTTLMNALGALDMPTNGQVLFDNRDITKMSELKRDALRRKEIGFIFQSVALISMMSAYENVEFALRVSGFSARERALRAQECLEAVGLTKRMQHRPSELSGGEQQRVAIARAIAHRPRVLFADEPTAEVDTRMGFQIMLILREMVERDNATIVMTTHDENMMELGDHVYTLEDGRIIDEQFNKIQPLTAEVHAQ